MLMVHPTEISYIDTHETPACHAWRERALNPRTRSVALWTNVSSWGFILRSAGFPDQLRRSSTRTPERLRPRWAVVLSLRAGPCWSCC